MAPPASHPTTLFVRNLSPQTTKADLSAHFSGIGPLRRTLTVTDGNTGLCKGFGFIHYALSEDASKALHTLNGSLLRGRRVALDPARPRDRSAAEKDADGGLVPRKPRARHEEPKKKPGALKGSTPMRTVLLKRASGDRPLQESEVRGAFEGCAEVSCESVVLSAGGGEARCLFASWAEAGRAAAAAHGEEFSACVEALRGGKKTRLIVRNLPFKVSAKEVREAFSKFAPVRELRLAPPKGLKGLPEKSTGEEGDGVAACAGFGFVEYFLVADAKYALGKLNGAKVGGRVIAVDMAMDRSDYLKRVEQEEEEEADEEQRGTDHSGSQSEESDSDDASESEEDAGVSSDEVEKQRDQIGEKKKGRGGNEKEVQPAEPAKKPASSTADEMTRTVFVRNLLFETSAPELWKALENEFGRVEQAVLVTHPLTKRPRGTAFVRFASEEDANKAVLRAAAGDTSKSTSRSALGAAGNEGFVLQGRPLMLSKAVDRNKARALNEEAGVKGRTDDPRNLRLAWIGQIKSGTPEAKGLSEQDLARRAKSVKDKKTKLERNPNAFVSDVRLSVRNLPRECDEKTLKQLFLIAADKKAVKTKAKGGTQQLTSESKKEVGHPRVTHCTIVCDPERNERSKGYGFVQFDNHEHALTALQAMNSNPKALDKLIKVKPKVLNIDEHRERLLRKQWGDNRRLQVEFSVEDRRKVQILERIKEKGKRMKAANMAKKAEGGSESGKNSRKEKKKAKRDKKTGGEKQEVEKTLSKEERKSAMKRKRAEKAKQTAEPAKNPNSSRNMERKEGNQSPAKRRKVQRVDNSHNERRNSRKAGPKRSLEDIEMDVRAEQADPKPKKPKRRKNAAEAEKDQKLDSLVAAYRRKLEKGAQKAGSTSKNGSGSQLQTAAASRWFD